MQNTEDKLFLAAMDNRLKKIFSLRWSSGISFIDANRKDYLYDMMKLKPSIIATDQLSWEKD